MLLTFTKMLAGAGALFRLSENKGISFPVLRNPELTVSWRKLLIFFTGTKSEFLRRLSLFPFKQVKFSAQWTVRCLNSIHRHCWYHGVLVIYCNTQILPEWSRQRIILLVSIEGEDSGYLSVRLFRREFPGGAVSSLKDGSAGNLPHRLRCADSYSHKHFCGEKIYSRQGTRRWENKVSIPASGTGQYGSFVLLRNF